MFLAPQLRVGLRLGIRDWFPGISGGHESGDRTRGCLMAAHHKTNLVGRIAGMILGSRYW